MALFCAAIPAIAQTPAPADLDTVLARVHDNFESYLQGIPNLLAAEHMTSTMIARNTGNATVSSNESIDSNFQLARDHQNKTLYNLVETHEVTLVDKARPPKDYTYSAPFLVKGAFSYAIGILSPQLKPCYDFTLLPEQKLHGARVLVITYSLKKDPDEKVCSSFEANTGRAYIDPATMQVLRFEQHRPHHPVDAAGGQSQVEDTPSMGNPGGSRRGGMSLVASANTLKIGPDCSWSWSVDYAPVKLNDDTFWLPKKIESSAITISGTLVSWQYINTYSDYHMLSSSVTLIMGYHPQPDQK